MPSPAWIPAPSPSNRSPISATPRISYPDFIVKLSNGSVVIVETKGLVDVDVPHKMRRLAQWIADLNDLQSDVNYDFAFVDEAGFQSHRPRTFTQLLQSFRDFKTVQA